MMHHIFFYGHRIASVILLLCLCLIIGSAFADTATGSIQPDQLRPWVELPIDHDMILLASDSTMLNKRDVAGNTLLHLAIDLGRDDLALFLIDQSIIAVDAVNSNGETALHRAIIGGRLDIIKRLLQRGSNLEIANARGERPVHLTARIGVTDLLQLLLDRDVDLLARTLSGETALDIACRFSHLDFVERLLFAGVNGPLPAHTSASLMSRAIRNYDADRLLLVGGRNGDLAVILDDGKTFLNMAVARGDRQMAERLLNAGAPIDLQDQLGRTPVHVAAGLSPDLLSWLVKLGARIDVVDENGCTPLHFAANCNATASAQILIEHGINLNARDATGQTSVHMAAALDASATLQLLLKSGADAEARDNSGATALHHASRYRAKSAALVLVEAGADRLATDYNGRTPLHVAALFDDVKVARVLLGEPHQAEREPGVIAVDVADVRGETPLFLAIRGRIPFWENRTQRSPSCLELLVEWGAEFDIRNASGETPLNLLVSSAQSDLICSLRTIELPVNEPDGAGNTPLQVCVGLSAKLFPDCDSRISYDSWSPDQPHPPFLLDDYDPPVRRCRHWGTSMNQRDFGIMLNWNRLRIMKFLMEHGADAKRFNRKGQSPITSARNIGDDAALEILTGKQAR